MRNKDLWEWLGFEQPQNWVKAPWIGRVLGVTLIIFLFLLFIAALWSIGLFLKALAETGSFTNGQTGEAIRNVGFVVVAIFGAPFLIWRVFVIQKQANVAEQGMITDRINKAVEGLGAEQTRHHRSEKIRYAYDEDGIPRHDQNGEQLIALSTGGDPILDVQAFQLTAPNLEVRIGAIFALERISRDSPRDHIQIMEILCAYIRGNAPTNSLAPTNNFSTYAKPREDIQTAITVIGRRPSGQIELEYSKEFSLDLSGSDLSGINFSHGNFSAAKFIRCRIEGANFHRAVLEGTRFTHSLLNYTLFKEADLFGTRFDNANISQPASLNKSNGGIMDANVRGIIVAGANLSSLVKLHESENLKKMLGTRETTLHFYPEKFWIEFLRKCEANQDFLQTGAVECDHLFSHWLPYGYISDSKRNELYTNFLNKFGYNKWPHV